MEHRDIKLLILDDNDLNCDCPNKVLSSLTLRDTNFNPADLIKYDLIVYRGLKGTKILKSTFFMV